jgi:DNA replication protein DnaC
VSAPDSIAKLLAPALDGVRFYSKEELDAERINDERAEIVRVTRNLRAAIEPKLTPQEFENYAPDPRLRGASEKYTTARGSLLALGPAGCGKTVMVKRLARRLLRDAWRAGDATAPIVHAVFVSALELTRAITETRLGVVCEALREAQRVPLLLLDEIGQEAHDPRWLLELLDRRYGPRHLPTIATSGLTHAELVARYGTGCVRRLTEPVGTLLDLFVESPRG